ncbi:MAG: restriction endonuclease subunit S [Caldithrix sp.]|nr:MAG: restriction endonuclease subunit S [Caldithrix sp.]
MRYLVILNDIANVVDCEHKTAPTEKTGYPSIRTPNIGRGRLILAGVNRVSKKTYELWARRAIPQTHDLILAREAPVGNVAIIPNGLKVCLGQRTVLIQPDRKNVNPHYLTYLLLGNEIQGRFKSVSTGATVAHLNVRDIRDLPLPELPPLETQRKIAAILSAYDDLIENNLRRIKILEEMAQRLYREWFVHFRFPGHEKVRLVDSSLGKIPEGWEVAKLGDVIELAYGKGLKASERIPGEVPVYGSGGIVGFHNESLVTGAGIIVGRKGNVGSVNWSDVDFFPIDTVFYVKTKLPMYYVFYNLQTQNFINTDAAVPGLSRNSAYLLSFIVPGKNALQKFEEMIQPIFAQIRNLKSRDENLRQTRDLLLPRLISGELDVSELAIKTANENDK